MNRIVFLIGVIAVLILLFAPAATSQAYTGDGRTAAKATADGAAKASGRQNYLRIRTGGPPLAAPAALVLIGSCAAATAIIRRYISS